MITLPQAYLLTIAAPIPTAHVIVDGSPRDPAAVVALTIGLVTLIAVGIQIHLAWKTLRSTNRELRLAKEQLEQTKKATEQTAQALLLTRDQVRLAQSEAVASIRRTAPQVVAEVRDEDLQIPQRTLYVINKGNGAARYVTVSGMTPGTDKTYEIRSAAGHVVQTLAPGEERAVMTLAYPTGSYAQNIRVRYEDIFGCRYITEYQSINEGLSYPVFREPWIGRDFGLRRPTKWSGEVSWPVEHYERLPNVPDELVEVSDEAPPPEADLLLAAFDDATDANVNS
jgi:hypothetical protein